MYVYTTVFLLVSAIGLSDAADTKLETRTNHWKPRIAMKGSKIEEQLHRLDMKVHQNIQTYVLQNQKSIRELTKLVKDNNNDTHEQIKNMSRDIKKIAGEVAEQSQQLGDVIKHQLQQSKAMTEMREHQFRQSKEIRDLTDKVNRLHPVTTPAPLTTSTSHASTTPQPTTPAIPWVYYPRGTHENHVNSYYPQYNATFVAFGQSTGYKSCKKKTEVSFLEGLEWCYQLRMHESNEYNSYEYRWTSRYCYCSKTATGHDDDDIFLFYHF